MTGFWHPGSPLTARAALRRESRGVYGGKRCRNCQSVLSPDEIALHRKLHNRAADSFLCIACNAQYFGVATQLLEEKIRQFKEMGCTLFQ